ncbi:MAG: translation initiation factor IF-1 [Acidobacteria bacterium]|nr:translation initiation factor IF-1 [Acidobacteriota bacterium]
MEPRTILGTVIELLPSLKARVELEDRRRIVAHAGAASKVNFVRLRPGDQVAVVISPQDETRGRIVKLLEPQVRGRSRGIAEGSQE